MTQSSRRLADRRLGELIDAVASAGVSPGAGAAGAITLALAAACAGKAVAITLGKHPARAGLAEVREQLETIGREAVAGADEDAGRFAAFVHDPDAGTAHRLLEAEEHLQRVAAALVRILESIETQIDPVMAGDVAAAKALCQAFEVIQSRNLEETRRGI